MHHRDVDTVMRQAVGILLSLAVLAAVVAAGYRARIAAVCLLAVRGGAHAR